MTCVNLAGDAISVGETINKTKASPDMLLPFVLHHDHLITSLVATPRLFSRPPTAKLIIISLIMGTTVGEVVSSCDRCASSDYDERRRIMRTS